MAVAGATIGPLQFANLQWARVEHQTATANDTFPSGGGDGAGNEPGRPTARARPGLQVVHNPRAHAAGPSGVWHIQIGLYTHLDVDWRGGGCSDIIYVTRSGGSSEDLQHVFETGPVSR